MAADRIITCTNDDGDSVTFTETGLFDFILVDATGLYEVDNAVQVEQNTMTDGGIYQSSVARYRNIVLTVCDSHKIIAPPDPEDGDDDVVYITSGYIKGSALNILTTQKLPQGGSDGYVRDRDLLNKIFKNGKPGRLRFEEGGEARVIDYYVESFNSTGGDHARTHTISLICPDPFFYDPDDQNVYIAEWVSDFDFVHEFAADGEEFGHYVSAYENIHNESADENIGITAIIQGKNVITNPSITRMESNETIQVGDDNKPFTLEIGDILTITTGTGNKHVYLTSGGVTTEINQYLTEDSTFIQLMRGNNNIGYDADLGKGGMTVRIIYRLRHVRA